MMVSGPPISTIYWQLVYSGEKSNFQYILRLLNTNVEGKQKVMFALTKIKASIHHSYRLVFILIPF